jgi:hypothetical protein
MDLDAPIDITIGPYETYNDDIFGYKASFEVYVNLRDEAETAKLKFFADHLQEVENNLPIDPRVSESEAWIKFSHPRGQRDFRCRRCSARRPDGGLQPAQ